MSLTIRRFLDRFFPAPENAYKIPLLGLDASGKTTLLHRLKTGGEVTATIPTIGFNVENIDLSANLNGVRRVIKIHAWDTGGCDKVGHSAKFLAPWTAGSEALIWVVDSTDRERVSESVDEVGFHINTLTTSNEYHPNQPTRGGLPVLILATKQDMVNPIPIPELETRFAKATAGCPVRVLGMTLATPLDQGAFPEAIGWLLGVIKDVHAKKVGAFHAVQQEKSNPAPSGRGSGSTSPPTLPDPRAPAALEKTLASWLERAEADSPADTFLQQFADLSLPSWDHYTHIRIAYLLLTIHGRQKGKNMIFDGLERYIAQSTQTRGRTFHVTMTYFWIQMVHFGISSLSPRASESTNTLSTLASDTTLVPTPASDAAPPMESNAAFARFLLLNPFVADGGLWSDYYTKDVMMSPSAKAGMMLPDKKPLPNLVPQTQVWGAEPKGKAQ